MIVLEDVSSLDEDGHFRYLQEPLSVQVIIIHSALLSCPTDFVLLDEIDRSAAIQYANYLKGRYYVTAGVSDQEVETVLAVAGGKPYQIRQTLYELLQN